MLHALFVYGTLKQGYLRSCMWPHAPQAIETGMVRGRLLDLGAYPGLMDGDEWILGEVWILAEEHLSRTLTVLDEIEGYDPISDSGLYLRREISVRMLDSQNSTLDNPECQAFTYMIADEHRIAAARHIRPMIPIGDRLAAQWPDSLSRVPERLEDE